MHAIVVAGAAALLAAADGLPANQYVDPASAQIVLTLVIGAAALEMAARARLGPEVITAWRRRTLLLLATATFALLAAEAATRFVFRHVTTSADTGSFFSRRWLNDVQFNASGFRAPEFDRQKRPGTYRIAVIGDSFTFGNGLTVEERYTARLDERLPDRYEVLNFGIGGNNTPQHLEVLTRHVLPAGPDFVLLQWYVNDIEGNDVHGRPQLAPLLPAPLHTWVNRHSALYAVANLRWAELQIAFGWVPSYADYLKARAGDPNSADAQRESRLLREFIDAARRQGAAVGIVLFPDTGPALDASYPFAYLHERVLGICRDAGIPCLDLREHFATVTDRRSLWVSPFDHHPSARANELAALKILEVFAKHWQPR